MYDDSDFGISSMEIILIEGMNRIEEETNIMYFCS